MGPFSSLLDCLSRIGSILSHLCYATQVVTFPRGHNAANRNVTILHVHDRRRIRSQTAPAPRSVRWCENLICPSPILPSQRRKGWFNRRGDQLWRNDGSYRPPPPGEAYPPDLDDYPEARLRAGKTRMAFELTSTAG
ncbi:hypothetical protein EDC04DRAFT_559990 [Pisolithus marmoratus]|nr:hypothetical protein EDC04DRAFT_559990 [Pisolithus marmoratus]